jgi:hypothetical protein
MNIIAEQIPEGCDLVLRVDRLITSETAQRIRDHAAQCLPGRKVLVLTPEITVEFLPDMRRLEAKVDQLLAERKGAA